MIPILKKCVRCGEEIGMFPGPIWIEELGGEVCMECYEEIVREKQGLPPKEQELTAPSEIKKAQIRRKRVEEKQKEPVGLENADLSKLYELLQKIHKLLAFLAVMVVLLLVVIVMFLVQGPAV
ncbi:MAG: hypothetical protein KHZ93_08370 [Clostridiales bacterium]|nr:hypothetical protein [Clostridiales bacterium]